MMPWLCPRCKKMNAPWLNQCFCGPDPAPITDPSIIPTQPGNIRITDAALTQTGSFVLTFED